MQAWPLPAAVIVPSRWMLPDMVRLFTQLMNIVVLDRVAEDYERDGGAEGTMTRSWWWSYCGLILLFTITSVAKMGKGRP